jgi:hypothetical protein
MLCIYAPLRLFCGLALPILEDFVRGMQNVFRKSQKGMMLHLIGHCHWQKVTDPPFIVHWWHRQLQSLYLAAWCHWQHATYLLYLAGWWYFTKASILLGRMIALTECHTCSYRMTVSHSIVLWWWSVHSGILVWQNHFLNPLNFLLELLFIFQRFWTHVPFFVKSEGLTC